MYAKAADTARVYSASDAAYANTLQQRAIKLDFAPPLKAFETLHRLYFPLRFKGGTGIPTQHPVLAGHQRVAEEALHAFARNCDSVLEIGPSLASAAKLYGVPGHPVPVYHGCTKSSTRDCSRHIAAMQSRFVRASRPEFVGDAALLASGIPSDTFCVDGVGSCAHKAQVGISCHSLYNVSLEELANGFHNHDLQLVKAFMHMPEELLYMDEVVNNELGYRFKVIDDEMRVKDCAITLGDVRARYPVLSMLPESTERKVERLVARTPYARRFVVFAGNDDWADAYIHDFHTWLSYLLVRNYPTPFGFSLHIEVQRRHGSSIELRITRAPPGERIMAIVPRTSYGLCRVPNIFYYADPERKERRTILTSQHKVNMLLNFMQTRPEKELNDLTVLMSFARARLRAIIVATEVAESAWHISPGDLVRVVASLFIIGLVERRRAHLAIAKARGDLIDRTFWAAIARSLVEIKDSFLTCIGLRAGPRVFDPEVVKKYALISLEDIVCDVQLTPEEIGYLPGRYAPARVYHDREELEILRGAGVYRPDRPEPSAPPAELAAPGGDELWAAACAGLPEYRAGLVAGQATDSRQMKIVLETAMEITNGLTPQRPKAVQLYCGPPGSGKTGTILAALEVNNTKALYIAPTKELRASMDTRIKVPSAAATQHAALPVLRRATAEGKPFAKIIVDECFMFPLTYITILSALSPESEILLVGDRNQIGFIDFQGVSAGLPTVLDIVPHIQKRVFNETRRCPADVVSSAFFQSLYPGCTTTSKCVASIEYVPPDYRQSNAQTLTFTQEEKSRCAPEGAMTVHEAQGRTFASVILHYNGSTAEQKLLAENAHLLVGITRHTNHLYVRDATGDIERKLNHSARVEVFTDVPTPQEVTTVKPREEAMRNEPKCEVPAQSSVPAGAIHILRKAFGDQPDCGCQALAKTGYEVFGAKARINIELIEPDADPKPYRAFQEGVQWVKVTSASNKHQALQTLLSRYTKTSKNLPEADAQEDVRRMLHALDKHWDWTVTKEARERATFETLQRFTERGGTIDDLMEPDDPYIKDIDFLMKTQQKVSTKPMNSGKVGQGIAAHSKSLNFVLATWVRILEEVLRTGSETVRYSNGLSDDEEALILEAKVNQVPRAAFVSADWTEFDTAHNITSEILFARLLERVGAPARAVELFRLRCGKREVRAKGLGSVTVDGLLDSGAVWTLCRNTIFSAAVMLTLFRGVKLAAFKGDDSLLVGSDKLTFTPERLHMGAHYSKKHLKVERQRIVPYIGLLVADEQVVVDPIRCALKVFGRCYPSEPLYEKYVDAMRDITTGWRDAKYHQLLVQMAAAYYNIDAESVAYIVDAVLRFARGDFPFSSLSLVRSHAQAPDAYNETYPAVLRPDIFERLAVPLPTPCPPPKLPPGADKVFEPRIRAPSPVRLQTPEPGGETITTVVEIHAVPLQAGCIPPPDVSDVIERKSKAELLAQKTPSARLSTSVACLASFRPSSALRRASGLCRSLNGVSEYVRTSRNTWRRASRCRALKGGKTGNSSTAPTATGLSRSASAERLPTTPPPASPAANLSVTQSCDTAQIAAKTTAVCAQTVPTPCARAVASPYRPPTTARWKPVTPLHLWEPKEEAREKARDDPETLAQAQALKKPST